MVKRGLCSWKSDLLSGNWILSQKNRLSLFHLLLDTPKTNLTFEGRFHSATVNCWLVIACVRHTLKITKIFPTIPSYSGTVDLKLVLGAWVPRSCSSGGVKLSHPWIRGTLLPDGKTLCTFISPGAQGRRVGSTYDSISPITLRSQL